MPDARLSLTPDDLDRIAAWCRGYRRMVKGGSLGTTVHTACTFDSEWQDGYGSITVDDVESLLALAVENGSQ